jgi:hypothetical protein
MLAKFQGLRVHAHKGRSGKNATVVRERSLSRDATTGHGLW